LMIFWVYQTMRSMKRAPDDGDFFQYRLCMSFLVAAMVGFYVSGNFSNNSDQETQFWCLGLLASVYELQKLALARAQSGLSSDASGGSGVIMPAPTSRAAL